MSRRCRPRTGIRTPLGIKIKGPQLDVIQRVGQQIEQVMKDLPGTRNIYAERVAGGYYLDYDIRRQEIARYGLTVDDVEEEILSAVGGMDVTTTIEGRERYPVCGELLILGKSAIRHTHTPATPPRSRLWPRWFVRRGSVGGPSRCRMKIRMT